MQRIRPLPGEAYGECSGAGRRRRGVLYHLTKIGITDVVVCKRKQLTSGTTWHAAGLVTQLRATRRMTELVKYTGELFDSLEAEGRVTGRVIDRGPEGDPGHSN